MLGFLKGVCLNVISVAVVAVAIPAFLTSILTCEGWKHFLLMVSISVLCTVLSVYVVGCSKNERAFIIQRACILRNKLMIR